MLLVIIISVISGLISSYVANEKGRNWLLWLIFGFLGGPLGMLLILLWPKDQKVLDEKALYYGHLKKCPACAELIKPDANKCRFCGTELDNYEPIIEINPDESADKQNT